MAAPLYSVGHEIRPQATAGTGPPRFGCPRRPGVCRPEPGHPARGPADLPQKQRTPAGLVRASHVESIQSAASWKSRPLGQRGWPAAGPPGPPIPAAGRARADALFPRAGDQHALALQGQPVEPVELRGPATPPGPPANTAGERTSWSRATWASGVQGGGNARAAAGRVPVFHHGAQGMSGLHARRQQALGDLPAGCGHRHEEHQGALKRAPERRNPCSSWPSAFLWPVMMCSEEQ